MSPLPAMVLGRRAASARIPAISDRTRIAGVAAVATIYATLRYNVAKGVPWSDWPSYIANKVLAVTALVLLAWAALRKLRGAGSTASLMRWGGGAAMAHVVMSLGLFSLGYFEKLFAQGKLTFAGGFSLLLAALATVILEVGARQSAQWPRSAAQRATLWLLALSTLHTMTPSATGWLTPASWPAYLPPLTLLASLPAIAALILGGVDRRKPRISESSMRAKFSGGSSSCGAG